MIAAANHMTSRQPNAFTSKRRGAPALTAPSAPTASATPEVSANCRGGIQWLAIFNIATKATPTEAPINKRPRFATVTSCAIANTAVPIPAMIAPAVSNRRGPNLSAKIPVGICIAT